MNIKANKGQNSCQKLFYLNKKYSQQKSICAKMRNRRIALDYLVGN